MGRPDLSLAFTKIAVWRQVQFRKILYLDADVLALRAPDELFDIKDDPALAAVGDVGWPSDFNSGVMMLKPDMGDYYALEAMATGGDSYDGADQGLLNKYFGRENLNEPRKWYSLDFTYNCTPSAGYQYEPAYRYHEAKVALVHFIGKTKPWNVDQDVSQASGVYKELLGRWWAVYNRHYKGSGRDASGTLKLGEAPSTAFGTSSAHHPTPVPHIVIEAPTSTVEPPLSEPGEPAAVDQAIIEPNTEPFSAPQAEWDATR